MIPVKNAITTWLQHFELVVQPFDKATAGLSDKVIRDLLPSMRQSLQEPIETLQSALLNPFDPGLDLALSVGLGGGLLEDSGQLSAQVIGLLQFRGIFLQLFQGLALFET